MEQRRRETPQEAMDRIDREDAEAARQAKAEPQQTSFLTQLIADGHRGDGPRQALAEYFKVLADAKLPIDGRALLTALGLPVALEQAKPQLYKYLGLPPQKDGDRIPQPVAPSSTSSSEDDA